MAHWLSGNWLALLAPVVAIVALIPALVAVHQGRCTRQTAIEVHDVTWALVWIRPGLQPRRAVARGLVDTSGYPKSQQGTTRGELTP